MALASSPAVLVLLGTVDGNTPTGVTTGTSQPIEIGANDELAFYFESIGTTSGGTVLIETASRQNYSGTWSTMQTVSASDFTGTAQKSYHFSPNAYAWVRVRVSSTITGGGSIVVTAKKQGS